MSLSDIKNDLYSKKPQEKLLKHDGSEFDIRTGGVVVDKNIKKPEDAWEPKKSFFADMEHRKALRWGARAVIGIIVLALIVFGVFRYIQTSFSEEKVSVTVVGNQSASSGELLTYEINYTNNNRSTLKDAIVRVTYPESFKPGENVNFKTDGQTTGVFTVGEIKGKTSGKVVLTGSAYSTRGSLMYIKGELVYKPSNSSSQFIAKSQLAVNINSSPVSLEIMAPQELASGDSLDYEIRYINSGKEDFDSIKIKADYPEGFTFAKSVPVVSEGNNIWYIGQLPAGQSGKIVVSGKLEGNKDDVRNITAHIGTSENGQFIGYNEEKIATKIVASPIIISQTVNGTSALVVKAGDNLRFSIAYKNNSDVGLRNVIITDKIDSPLFDYSSLSLAQGAFDQNNKTITWKGVDNPTLKFLGPGQSGEVSFSIRVKSTIPVATANDKNFVLSSAVKIDSPDIKSSLQANKVIAGNALDMKLESKIAVDVKGFYNDTTIANSGPIPPKVGSATTYTIHWKASNVSNDVANAQISTELPTGVTMTGKISPDDGRLTYNFRNNSIVWDIGNLAAGTGLINQPKEVSFQVQITPAQNQFDQKIDLLGPTIFSAKDSFTNTDLTFTATKKDTELQEDSSIGAVGYKVVN